MSTINLLPRVQPKKRKKKSIILFALFFLLMLLVVYHFPKKNKPVIHSKKIIQKNVRSTTFKWMGYLYDQEKFIGLIKLSNGVMQEVQVGSLIADNAKVININESGMILMKHGKKERVGDVI